VTAEVIGEAQVLITADFSTFDDELRAKLTNAARRAGNDAEKSLKRSGDRGGKAFADGVSKAAASQKTLESIRGAVERLEAASVRAGDAQTDAANRVARAEAALAKVKRTTSIVTLDGAEKIIAAEQRVAKAKRDSARADALAQNASNALAGARAKLAAEGARAGDSFGNELSKAVRKSSGKAGDDSGNFFSRAFRTAASKAIGQNLFRGLVVSAGSLVTALSPLSTLLGGGTAAVVALAAALAQASGAAISLGGVLGALGLAAVAVKVGFSGLGDAMKAQSAAQAELAATGKVSEATQKKLDAALKGLAPSARAVVKELGAMAPAWQAVQRSVQEKLFSGVATQLQNLGNRFLPILTTQLGTAASTVNRVVTTFTGFITQSNRVAQVNTIFTGLNKILSTLAGPLTSIAGGFLDIFTASLPFAQQLANVLQSIGLSFGEWLGKVADGEGFQTFMQNAMQTAGTLFQLLGNIGRIIGSVFAAGAGAGANLLTILRNLTGAAAQFLQSAEGQKALASFFGLIGQAGQVVVGVFKTLQPLLSGIGALFSALQGPIKVLGAALTQVFGQLATTLGGALAQLGPVIGQLVVALAPVITILGGVLNGVLQAIVPLILSLVQAFATLVPALAPIVQILGVALTTTLSQLSGLLVQIVPILAQFIAAIAAGLQPVLAALQPVLATLISALIQVVQALLPILTSLLPLIPAAAQLSLAITQLVIAMLPLVTSILGSLASLLATLAPYIPPLVSLMTQFTLSIVKGVQALTKIVAAISNFVASAISKFASFRNQGIQLIASFISGAVSFFSSLPGKVSGAISSLVSTVKSGLDKVVSFFKSLPGKVAGAISGMASALFTAGSQAVAGLVNGIKSKAGEVLSAAKDLASKVKDGIGGALKIFSPSRVTTAQGEQAGQGLANGLLNKVRTVGRAATDLANAVPDAVGKSLTKLNSSLISLSNSLPASAKRRIDAVVSSGKTAYASLAKASDAVDAKLKASQTKLQDLLQKSQQLAQSVAQAVLSTGDITQGQDTSFRGIVSRLQTAVTNARQFTQVIAKLQKAGLNSTSLQQIINAGPETGAAIGQSLLSAGRAGITQVNKLQTQLQTAANQAAKSASDAIFGQGVALAKGVVAGLAQQKASLDKQMTRLADVLVLRVLKLLQALKLPGVNTLKIPGLKDGGVVNGVPGAAGTLIRAGEYGRKEAVIPLERPKRARELMDSTGLSALVASSKGGKSKTVEVPINVSGNVVDYEALTAHIEGILRRFGFTPKLGIVTPGGKL
jgi:phage-related protein